MGTDEISQSFAQHGFPIFTRCVLHCFTYYVTCDIHEFLELIQWILFKIFV